MVEGTALEMRHLGNWIESSNLSPSAYFTKHIKGGIMYISINTLKEGY